MLISNAPCSWGITRAEGNKIGWRQYLDELAEAGFRGTELGPLGYLPTDPDVLGPELAKRNLVLVGATHVHTFGAPDSDARLFAEIDTLTALLSTLGAHHLVLMDESEWYPPDAEGVLAEDGWQHMVKTLDEAQRRIAARGLIASFHPHLGTAVEREAQIDRLLAETGIGLCLDTGHHAAWGQDALAYLEAHFDRLAYVHLKNVDPAVRDRLIAGEISVATSYGLGLMSPLDDGAVDIAAVMDVLVRRWFSGPVVVEQDLAEDSPPPLVMARRNLSALGDLA